MPIIVQSEHSWHHAEINYITGEPIANFQVVGKSRKKRQYDNRMPVESADL